MEETVAFTSKLAQVGELVAVPIIAFLVMLAHAFMDTILMLQVYLGAA